MENYVCKLCGNNTDWDSSVGLENFLVCNWCVHRLAKANKNLGSDFANLGLFYTLCCKVLPDKRYSGILSIQKYGIFF